MKVLIVDNYDSFTYNLYHYVEMCGVQVAVKRNDAIQLSETQLYDKLILSPGPGLPNETHLMYDILAHYTKPILGVCLGMQGIAQFFGASLQNQQRVKHGVKTEIQVDKSSKLYQHVPSKFQVGLYHSWCVSKETIPEELKLTGLSTQNVVMSVEHRFLPIFGIQYHPESILSEYGLRIIRNFIENC